MPALSTAHQRKLRFCKTPKLKIDASRFIGKTVCICFNLGVLQKIQKAQIMTVERIKNRLD